jgi:hypothetical protein
MSLTVVSLGIVRASRNSSMQKPILIWIPAFAILVIALAAAVIAPPPNPPGADQRADR